MTITYVIPGATLLDQLASATLDGLPNNDANDNCVGTSIAEGLHILTGQNYDGDAVKDAVYGAGYVGFESASAYVAYCASQGVDLVAHDDTQAGLIATIHAEVGRGNPVLVTMPSQWGTAPVDPVHPSGSTHVGCAVGIGDQEIRVMNPWHAFWQDASDTWWQARLCYGQVWLMRKASATMTIPAGWSDDGTTLRAPNGVPVIGAIRAFVLGNAWDASDTPMAPEQTVSQVELANAAIGGGARQFFKISGQVSWNATFNHGAAWRTWAGQELFAYYNQLVKDAQAIQQLQNAPAPTPAPTPAPAPAPAPDPAIAAKATALDDLMALYGIKG